MNIHISFVIPCYCSEKNLDWVVNEIRMAMEKKPEFAYEIILVNDNSKDNTKDVIDRMAREDHRITGVHFAKNFGQPAALLAGFRLAKGEFIMTCDDDGQTPPSIVWDFYDKIQQGYDVVCAKYVHRHRKSFFRSFGTHLNEWMLKHCLGKPDDLGLSSFFMARRRVIEEAVRYQGPYPYMAGLLLRSTNKFCNLEMEQLKRRNNSSGYTLSKLLKLWTNGLTAFSTVPLRIIFLLGSVDCAIGMLLFIAALILKLFITNLPLFNYILICTMLLLTGSILISMGVIGEYVGRAFMTINNAPQYVIDYSTSEISHEKKSA